MDTKNEICRSLSLNRKRTLFSGVHNLNENKTEQKE